MIRQGKTWKRKLGGVFVAAALCFSAVADGEEIPDLQGTYERMVKAVNARDLNTLTVFWDDHVVLSGSYVGHPIEGKEAWLSFLQQAFSTVDSVSFRPLNPQIQVTNTGAMIQAPFLYQYRWRDYQRTVRAMGHMTLTLVKRNGRWVVVEGRFSDVFEGGSKG